MLLVKYFSRFLVAVYPTCPLSHTITERPYPDVFSSFYQHSTYSYDTVLHL